MTYPFAMYRKSAPMLNPTPSSRRSFVKASGLALALPLLESHKSASAAPAPQSTTPPAIAPNAPAKRLVCIGAYLGYHAPAFYPEQTGRDYQTSPLLKPLDGMRDQFTVFSGLDHRAPNGHKNWRNFLTGAGSAAVSLDQVVAAQIGHQTRFASLEITCGQSAGSSQMCFTKEGINLPMIGRPSVLFGKLFSSESDKKRLAYVLDSGRSVLDQLNREAKSLQASVNAADRQKLEEYFTSVRDVEKKVKKQRQWMEKPTPTVDYQLPEFDPIAPDLSLECEQIMYDMMALAIQTDSTRVLSFLVPAQGQVFTIDGQKLSAGYHGLSHHGNDPMKIRDLVRIDLEHTKRFAAFMNTLRNTTDADGRPLLDTTLILSGTGMGNANIHSNRDLPTLVAGGGFKHGQHIALDPKSNAKSAPILGDLYISIMQQLGIEADSFANASHNMNQFLT